MRTGMGTLLLVTVAMTIIAGPSLVSSGGRPATIPQAAIVTPADIQSMQPTPTGVCEVEDDLHCTKCGPTQICPSKELVQTIRDFFGPSGDCQEAASSQVQSSRSGGSDTSRDGWGVPRHIGKTLRFVLAIVPDPTHTHLSLFFDRQIEALQQAAQEDGYNFARANMPWDIKEHPESPDLRLRLLQSDYTRNREQMPGLMIFRKTVPESSCEGLAPLFVFVVGETPTGGINKAQFNVALQMMKEIREDSGAPERPLYVLGPTFAGSLYSLMFLLKEAPQEEFANSVIHSGTVSSLKTIQWFQSYKDRPPFTFRTFQESDCYATAQLINLLRQEGYDARNVALLSEDESAYGDDPCGDPNVAQIHFPREISALRSAYQHDIRNDEESESSSKRPARSTLRSNLEDNGSDDDSVSSYSRLQTPLSQEAVLMGIISNLRSHHSRFVIIRATNPIDVLFLGTYLRNAYSEGRIVTMGADLRFQRETEDPKLRGILALTPYSLLPGADDHLAIPSILEKEPHTHRVFPSSLSVGTFNAMLSLLKCDMAAPQGQTPAAQLGTLTPANPGSGNKVPCEVLPVAHYSGYGWPILAREGLEKTTDSLVAPLWVTVLGYDGYWPVALLAPEENKSTTQAANPPTQLKPLQTGAHWGNNKIYAPSPWSTMFWLSIAVAMGFLFQMWKGSLLAASDMAGAFTRYNVSRLVFFVTDLLLLLMLLALSWPWVLWGLRFEPTWWPLFFNVLAISMVIWIGYRDLKRRRANALRWWFLGISGAAIIVSCSLAYLGLPLAQNFMMYRLIHVTSGVSPLVPLFLLLAAGLWWAWYTIVGLGLLDKRRPRLPRKEDLKLDQADGETHSRIQAALNQVSREEVEDLARFMKPDSWDVRLYAPPIVFLLLTGTAVELGHPVMSLEGRAYDIVYGLLLGLVIFILILGLARLGLIWLKLRELLTSLDQFPLRRSFERLEGFTWKPIWRLGSGALQDSYRLIWRQFDSLDHLSNEGISDDKLRQAVQEVRTQRNKFAAELEGLIAEDENRKKVKAQRSKTVAAIGEFFMPEPGWVKGWVEDLEELQKQLATTCGAALKALSRVWNEEKEVDMFEVSPKENQRPKRPKEAVSTQLAEQFVCLSYLNFILGVIFRMRTLFMSAAGIYVFAIFSFTSYPFEPRSAFRVLMVLLFLIIIGVVGTVLAGMHRNPTLSRITKTVPGELGIDFWFRLTTFIAIPLLSLLAAQVPSIQSFLFSWLEPLQGLK